MREVLNPGLSNDQACGGTFELTQITFGKWSNLCENTRQWFGAFTNVLFKLRAHYRWLGRRKIVKKNLTKWQQTKTSESANGNPAFSLRFVKKNDSRAGRNRNMYTGWQCDGVVFPQTPRRLNSFDERPQKQPDHQSSSPQELSRSDWHLSSDHV